MAITRDVHGNFISIEAERFFIITKKNKCDGKGWKTKRIHRQHWYLKLICQCEKIRHKYVRQYSPKPLNRMKRMRIVSCDQIHC